MGIQSPQISGFGIPQTIPLRSPLYSLLEAQRLERPQLPPALEACPPSCVQFRHGIQALGFLVSCHEPSGFTFGLSLGILLTSCCSSLGFWFWPWPWPCPPHGHMWVCPGLLLVTWLHPWRLSGLDITTPRCTNPEQEPIWFHQIPEMNS